jgi:opacity protein-like surface antigen
MRTLLISLAAAGAALAAASPAAAQYYPGQQYGYGQGYNAYGQGYSGYGYNGYNAYGGVRALQARIDRVEWQINRLDRYNSMGGRSADRLRQEAGRIERQLRQSARYGLNPYEASDIQNRIVRLEQRVQYASANRYGRYENGYGAYGGQGDYRDGDHQRGHDRDYGDDDDRD